MLSVSDRNYKLILVYVAVTFFGCSATFEKTTKSGFFSGFHNRNSSAYHEFSDVLIPDKLKIDRKKTCVFHTSKFSVGVLSLKGKMNVDPLISFFQKNMTDDNWDIVNSFKSRRSILLFKKGSRWCVICINGTRRSVYTEIWVLPEEVMCLTEFLGED